MKYHLIGIEGISMSALRDLLESRGDVVTGSDIKRGGHNAANIDSSIDIVVRTSAVGPNSPGWVEVEAAKKLGVPVMKRSELLGEITDQYELIAISGMHGKTTTTSLAGLVCLEAGLDPTVLVGEHISEFAGSALRIGASKQFVFEACEYDRSFLDFHPSILILTNIDEEHLDTYPGGLPEIRPAFQKYLGNIREGGVLIANRADENIRDIVESSRGNYKVIWYGGDNGEFSNLEYELNLPGEHNRSNALAVVALANYLQIDTAIVAKVFKNFQGAKRRLEYWGEINNSMLFDDYGHHPTEIVATLSAMKEKYPGTKLYVIFWPHQYKRLKPLMDKFAMAFEGAEKVFVKEIFFVPGRDEVMDISSVQLAEEITKNGVSASAFKEDEEIIQEILELSKEKCVMLTIGIPPIYQLWQKVLGE